MTKVLCVTERKRMTAPGYTPSRQPARCPLVDVSVPLSIHAPTHPTSVTLPKPAPGRKAAALASRCPHRAVPSSCPLPVRAAAHALPTARQPGACDGAGSALG